MPNCGSLDKLMAHHSSQNAYPSTFREFDALFILSHFLHEMLIARHSTPRQFR